MNNEKCTNKNNHKMYCTLADVHNGSYDCHYCDEGYKCLANECTSREMLWEITVYAYASHLDWEMGTHPIAVKTFYTFGNKLKQKGEIAVKTVQDLYLYPMFCNYHLKIVPDELHDEVVNNFECYLVNNLLDLDVCKNCAYNDCGSCSADASLRVSIECPYSYQEELK